MEAPSSRFSKSAFTGTRVPLNTQAPLTRFGLRSPPDMCSNRAWEHNKPWHQGKQPQTIRPDLKAPILWSCSGRRKLRRCKHRAGKKLIYRMALTADRTRGQLVQGTDRINPACGADRFSIGPAVADIRPKVLPRRRVIAAFVLFECPLCLASIDQLQVANTTRTGRANVRRCQYEEVRNEQPYCNSACDGEHNR
jgi:hypothetical protein